MGDIIGRRWAEAAYTWADLHGALLAYYCTDGRSALLYMMTYYAGPACFLGRHADGHDDAAMIISGFFLLPDAAPACRPRVAHGRFRSIKAAHGAPPFAGFY